MTTSSLKKIKMNSLGHEHICEDGDRGSHVLSGLPAQQLS